MSRSTPRSDPHEAEVRRIEKAFLQEVYASEPRAETAAWTRAFKAQGEPSGRERGSTPSAPVPPADNGAGNAAAGVGRGSPRPMPEPGSLCICIRENHRAKRVMHNSADFHANPQDFRCGVCGRLLDAPA